MTVWIINPFDNLPSEGYRPQRYWLMARGFASAGHKVVYWTSDFSHATKRKRALVREVDDGFVVRLVPSMPYPKNVCLRRLMSHWRLAHAWRRLAEQEVEKPDVVIASTPPLGLCSMALHFAKYHNALFVADIMDAWPETFERIAPKWMLYPMRCVARRIYRQADAVSAVASRYIDLARSYGATSLVKLSYHGIDVSGVSGQWSGVSGQWSGVSRDEKDSALQLRLQTTTTRLAYIGSFGASYDLETAITAVCQMPNVTLDIAGSGPKEAALRELASSCERIRFHGYLADAEMKALLQSCDIGLVPMFPDSCVGVPYKLADYVASGLRIVECLGGETRALVERFHAGVHYEPCDTASLVTALSQPSDAAWDAAGFIRQFDAKRIMAEYVSWVEGLKG